MDSGNDANKMLVCVLLSSRSKEERLPADTATVMSAAENLMLHVEMLQASSEVEMKSALASAYLSFNQGSADFAKKWHVYGPECAPYTSEAFSEKELPKIVILSAVDKPAEGISLSTEASMAITVTL